MHDFGEFDSECKNKQMPKKQNAHSLPDVETTNETQLRRMKTPKTETGQQQDIKESDQEDVMESCPLKSYADGCSDGTNNRCCTKDYHTTQCRERPTNDIHEETMTMTMTLRKVQHLSMEAWPCRQECRGHEPAKKKTVALMRLALLASCALKHC